jgi:toxin HigB-1
MIQSYRDKRTRELAEGKRVSNALEGLKGDRKGQYSIRINMQWRICFEWPDGQSGPSNVEIVDYH